MRKLIVGSILALGLLLGGTARAGNGTGYVCNLSYTPYFSTTEGNYGYFEVGFTSAPNCGGSWMFSEYACTAGATASWCGGWRYNEAGLLAVFAALKNAMVSNQRVYDGSSYFDFYGY